MNEITYTIRFRNRLSKAGQKIIYDYFRKADFDVACLNEEKLVIQYKVAVSSFNFYNERLREIITHARINEKQIYRPLTDEILYIIGRILHKFKSVFS